MGRHTLLDKLFSPVGANPDSSARDAKTPPHPGKRFCRRLVRKFRTVTGKPASVYVKTGSYISVSFGKSGMDGCKNVLALS